MAACRFPLRGSRCCRRRGPVASGLLILDIVMAPLTGVAFFMALGATWASGTTEIIVDYGSPCHFD